ncbi:acyl-CoA dehydrogenase family protein [Flectobacillus sp. BAB-3569]|uniref:acyl-CoA dehydrogenase family protein n=1 Tax=Flectobacillus sp. BAB-3569 TaxID=1509483 RepID=UPI000BA2FB27|nr:acyl-CoA dehydrogenase family protein [Flectobacillus sp. BAB-3569]PAC26666.1 acyl-CoA dehydrogenase [Flectobacillus sp. BAB-3569]
MNFSHAPKTLDLIQKVEHFVHEHILPIEEKFREQPFISNPSFREWSLDEEIESLKTLAKSQGLWNLFLPEISGLSNVEYAPLAEAMGYSLLAPEVFNCNAPDTGNMEVLWKYGTTEQKEEWLKPLLEGSIRSVFCMTEPEVASSDATNMKATIEDKGDYLLVNGTKWWSTGIGHPNCKIAIFMGLSNPEAAKHAQHSMVLIPLDTEGVTIKRMLPVFGTYDPPYGHGEVSFENVKVPKSNLIGGLGKGFEIAQGRLGPGRIHHCMRVIGASERALQLMIERGKSRTAFGKSLIELGGNTDIIANARMEIDMARLLVMKTAFLLDTFGIKGTLSEVSQIKVVAPTIACKIIDQAMQLFGGKGLSNDTPLAGLYAYARTLRLADGPDEVHRNVVAKLELKKYRES